MFGAYANLNDLVDFSQGEGERLFDRMDAIFEAAQDPNAEQFLSLHFAYAKGLEDRGEHARALEHYITGGRMKQRSWITMRKKPLASSIRYANSFRRAFSTSELMLGATTSGRYSSSGCRGRARRLSNRSFEPPRRMWCGRG